MRRLMFLPLLLLVACSLPNIASFTDGIWGKTAKPTATQSKATQSTAINSGAIETKTLAPIGQVAAPIAATPAPPKTTSLPLSPEEADCRAKGGQWAKAGKLAAMTCYVPSKDAGKSCSKQSDCSSQCLARSRTCAPIWPIFGCSDVLQSDGTLVKLCID